jgi:hypothetical protein
MKKLRIYLALNIIIVILETIGLSMAIANRRESAFQYYTQLSNLFLWITSILNIIFCIRILRKKAKAIPHFVSLLSYMSICTTTVTLIVVLFVLSWMVGDLWWILTSGAMLYTHTLCPILAIVMFRLFAPEKLGKKSAVYALAPTIAYAIIGIAMNTTHTWEGPYPFLQVYNQPLWASVAWIIGILGGAFLIALVLLLPTRVGRSRN